ncbi:MAG: Rrf2 family transcriptional regulator [Coxiellaceae bacterium]|nr:Rrf2 family transcriptional regulator [Coxiellaceae bacterium]
MQLTQFTDYALRTLIYLALRNDKTSTILEIAESYNISKSHLMKVVQRLSQLNIVKTFRGKGGGLQLNIAPDQLNLGNLIRKLEPNFYIVECFDKANGKCVIAPACQLKNILHEATNNFIQTLEQYTLKDIIHNHQQLTQLLHIQ